MIEVVSVNIGQKEFVQDGDRRYETGINKQSQNHSVSVGMEGLEGDAVCDKRFHGGPDQAIYLYRTEDYAWWGLSLGREIAHGTFGENLTVQGLSEPGLMVGDRLRFPDLEIEATAPRIPCSTLASIMGDVMFAKQFMQAARPGIYFRVIKSGRIEAGDRAELIPATEDSVSTVTFFHDVTRKLSRAEIQRYLALPIDIRSRTEFEKRLSRLN